MNDVFVHPTALVETNDIGEGTRIWAFTHVLQGARIGRRCNIGDHCFIEAGSWIGDEVTLKNGNMVKGITLEDGVFVGPGVIFTNDLYPRSPRMIQAQERYGNRQADSFGEFQLLMRDGDIISPHVEASEPLKEMSTHFLECISAGTRPLTDGWMA